MKSPILSTAKSLRSCLRLGTVSIASLILTIAIASAYAQDAGTPDTCRYEPVATVWEINTEADSVFSVELWGWSDDINVQGASLGFKLTTNTGGGAGHDDSLIVVDTFIYDPGLEGISFKTFTRSLLDTLIDPGAADWGYNGYALGLLQITDPIFPVSTPTKIGDLYIKILDVTEVSDTFDIEIDSSYFPPAGPFKYSPAGGSGFPPVFLKSIVTVHYLPCVDSDGDGYGDPGHPENVCPDDNCPYVYNPDQTDTDGDEVGDSCDVCPYHENDDCCNPVGSNLPPDVISPEADTAVPGWQPFEYVAEAVDPNCDGSEIIISFSDVPGWCIVTGDTLTGTAECDYEDALIKVIAFDGDLADTLELSLIIDKSNQPPEITDSEDPVTLWNQDTLVYYPSINDPDDSVHTITYLEFPHWCALDNDTIKGVAPDTMFSEPLTVVASDYCNADTLTFLVIISLCGDVDNNGFIDVDDAVFLINYIFAGGPAPTPYEYGDVDCSGAVDVDDAVYLINYIFAGGPSPCIDCP